MVTRQTILTYTQPHQQVLNKLLKTNQQPAAALSLNIFEENLSFTVYPNPADDVIYIQNVNNATVNFIHLIDSSGKIIKTYKDNTEQLDVSSVSSGNYLLFIQTPKQKVVKKMIIK